MTLTLFVIFLLVFGRVNTWLSLPYDSDNFLCDNFEELCQNALDEIGCPPGKQMNRGCGRDPKTNHKEEYLPGWIGNCSCQDEGKKHLDITGARIAKEIVDNRVKGDVKWNLDPQNPPYNIHSSFKELCRLTLDRIGCPDGNHQRIAVPKNGSTAFICNCGNFTLPSTRVLDLIIDKMNEALLMEWPVFENPFTLNIPLSIACILVLGKLGSIVAKIIYLPYIIGFLLVGFGIQDILSKGLMSGCGGDGPHPVPASELKTFALIIILLRAGTSLRLNDIKKGGPLTILMCFIPYLAEFGAELGLAQYQLGTTWSIIDVGLFTSILAPLSPSLVISGMLTWVDEYKLGLTPKRIVASAPIETVLSIINFSIFTSLEQTSVDPMYPWAPVFPLWATLVLIPVNIAFSFVLGFIAGCVIAGYIQLRLYFDRNNEKSNAMKITDKQLNRINALNAAERIFMVVVTAYTLYALCVKQYIPVTSGVLAVFALGLTIVQFVPADIGKEIQNVLSGIWIFAEVFLFVLTGASLAYNNNPGPAQSNGALDSLSILVIIELLVVGTLARSLSILVIEFICLPTLASHRRNILYILFWWITTWVCTIPKATVQAALGGVPLQNHLIPGAVGVSHGQFILQATAFSVLFCATIGVILTHFVGLPLGRYLKKKDVQAGTDQYDEPAKLPQ